MSATVAVFLVALALFVADVLPMGLTAFLVPVALYLAGVITPQEIFAPLIAPGVVVIVAMCVLGAALFKTGMAERMGTVLFRFCPGVRSLTFGVVLLSGLVSAFVSNTGTVAILIPVVLGAASARRISPSRVLIPLTAGATIGGNLSVIGSPGNLIAKDTIERFSAGAMTVPFFEFAKVGLPLLLATAVFYAFLGQRILPERGGVSVPPAATRTPDWRGWFVLAVLVVTVCLMVAGDTVRALPPMHVTASLGAAVVVLAGVLRQKEAFAAFDLQTVFLLAFMTPLGSAMVKTGAAGHISDFVVSIAGGQGPLVLTAVLWISVWILTQVMSNTAACALFCPVGWSVAQSLGADPRAVVIAVLAASSVAVCTPLAIPANSLILEPGHLRFKDFFLPGLCLSLVLFILSMLLLPVLYPFYR